MAISSGLWTLDLDAGTVSLDAGAAALVGLAQGALSQLLDCFEGTSAAVFQTELDKPHDLRLRLRSGKSVRSVSKPGGRQVEGLFVETASGASREEVLSALADRVPVVLTYLDAEERYLYANRYYLERYGRGAAVIGKTAQEVLSKEAYDRLEPLLSRTRAGETVSFETSVERPHGSPLWVSATYLPDFAHDGSVQGIAVISEDITARKEAEELRARGERELVQLAELIPQICWTNKPDGKVDFTNRRWTDYTGFAGVDWPSVVHPDDLARVSSEVIRAREEERDYEFEYRLRRHDGVYRWHLARSVVVRDGSGRQLKRLGTATDIHDQKTVEAELLKAVHVRDEFVSIASHELRTPLTSLDLRLQRRRMMLKRGTVVTPEQLLADTEVEERQVQRLTRLVSDLLDVTRIASGNLRLVPEPVDLAELTSDVLLRFRELVELAGCSISFEAQPVRGVWDRERLEQIAVNLLTNAARYAAGKPVAIRVEALPGKARLLVSDLGAGIAKADHERIFHRFERAAASRHLPGMGLGLYVSRQIARAHGGDIIVESEPGHGATFIVDLPVS